MRKLVITQNITLDGSIEMLGDWFSPDAEGDVSDIVETMQAHQDASDALLVGRQTFEDLRGYWPKQTDDQSGVTAHLNRVDKYVVSSTMTDPDWQNSTVIAGDPIDEARRLKAGAGKDIVVTGSITLTHALIAAGIVDELRLFVFPAVQGRGRRLFPDGHVVSGLRLVESTSFASDVALLVYALDG